MVRSGAVTFVETVHILNNSLAKILLISDYLRRIACCLD